MSREEIRASALRLLARREHSRRELRRKLLERGHGAEDVEQVVEELAAERLVDDGRFAEALVTARCGRGQGPVRVRAALQEHGVEDAVIREVMDTADPDWGALAASERRKRFGRRPDDYKERARQARFLQYRGFTAEQIRHALAAGPDESGIGAVPDDGSE